MSTRERIKRPEPERTQPVRNWSTVFGAPSRTTPPGVPSSTRAPTDPVARGVEAGYRVVDEYLRQGQSVARTMWAPFMAGGNTGPFAAGPPPPSPGVSIPSMPRSPEEAQQRMGAMLRSATDLAMMWMDFLGMGGMTAMGARPASTGPGGFDAGPFPSSQPHVAGGTSTAPHDGSARAATRDDDRPQTVITVELKSTRRTEVSVDLRAGSTRLPLIVHDLRATDAEGTRLAGIGIEGFPADDRVVVRVDVPDDLPAGTYNGLIVDELSSLPRGSLSVKVST